MRGEGSGLGPVPYLLSSPAAENEASSAENLTAGFEGEVSAVDRSTILRFGVRLFRPDELVLISLLVAAGTGRSFRRTAGSRCVGYSMMGLLTSTAERP